MTLEALSHKDIKINSVQRVILDCFHPLFANDRGLQGILVLRRSPADIYHGTGPHSATSERFSDKQSVITGRERSRKNLWTDISQQINIMEGYFYHNQLCHIHKAICCIMVRVSLNRIYLLRSVCSKVLPITKFYLSLLIL